MAGYKFIVNGDAFTARDTVYSVLANQSFNVTPIDDWSARAERGSAGASIAFGALAGKQGRHVILNISCQSSPDGLVISLMQGTSGVSGGLIGMSQADKIYSDIYNTVYAAFHDAGVLVSGGKI